MTCWFRAVPSAAPPRPCRALHRTTTNPFFIFNVLNRLGGDVTARAAAGHGSPATLKNILSSSHKGIAFPGHLALVFP